MIVMKRNVWKFVWLFLTSCLLLPGCKKADPAYYQGYVEGEFVYVATSVAGNLEKLEVNKGQTVAAGAPLFQLDPNPQALQIEEATQRIEQALARLQDLSTGGRPSELAAIEARLKTAQASLALASRDLERRQQLFASGDTDAVSREELDRFQSAVDVRRSETTAIEAELETAKLGGRADRVAAARNDIGALDASMKQLVWQLEEKNVAAPSAGVVQDTLYRVGEFVPAGRPVVSLLPPENIKVRFFVPQAVLPSIQMGDSIQVRLDGMDSALSARISYIAPVSEFTPPVIYSKESRSKLVFMMEAVPDAGMRDRLHPGQPLEVYLK